MGLELQMTTDLKHDLPSEIGFNFDELKADIAERVEHYNHLVVTEDTIKEAKDDRAKLNNLKKTIDRARINTKKVYMAPLNEFERKIKEVTALIDDPIKAIDTQLDVYEQKRREEKAAEIMAAYDKCIPDDLKDIIPLNRIQDAKWMNKTTTMKKVVEDLESWNARVNADLLALDAIEDQYKPAVKQKYIETLDVTRAIAYRDQLKAAEEAFRAREEERKAREEQRFAEEEKRRQTAENKAQEAQNNVEYVNVQPVEEEQVRVEDTTYTQLYKLVLEFQLTRDQAIMLKEFLTNTRISYRKV